MQTMKTYKSSLLALLVAAFMVAPLMACSNAGEISPDGDVVVSEDGPAAEAEANAGAAATSVTGKITLTEDELDARVGSYTYKGQTYEVSAREVMEGTNGIRAFMFDENSFSVPTADDTLGYVRNKLMNAEVEARGITITDEEVAAYAMDNFGSSDYEVIGTSYALDAETTERLIKDSALLNKLREQVIGNAASVVPPEMPAEPEEGEEDIPTAEYAAYIIGLAGDEWDADAGTWKNTGGAYESALATYEITSDAATYEAAVAAYYVAMSDYSNLQGEASTLWTEFINGVFSNVTITIDSLTA